MRKAPADLQASNSYSLYRCNSKVVSICACMWSYTTFLQSRIREVYRNLGKDKQFHLDDLCLLFLWPYLFGKIDSEHNSKGMKWVAAEFDSPLAMIKGIHLVVVLICQKSPPGKSPAWSCNIQVNSEKSSERRGCWCLSAYKAFPPAVCILKENLERVKMYIYGYFSLAALEKKV